jgi:hypothetical protein
MDNFKNTDTSTHDKLTPQDYDKLIEQCMDDLKILKKCKHKCARDNNRKQLLELVAEERAAYEQKKHNKGINFKVSDTRHRDNYWISKAKHKLAQQKITELEAQLKALSKPQIIQE